MPLSSTYYASGAGTTDANGTYSDERLGGGRDLPAFGNGTNHLYANGGGGWFVGPTLDDFASYLYRTVAQPVDPDTGTWEVGGGTLPAPTFSATAPAPTSTPKAGTYRRLMEQRR